MNYYKRYASFLIATIFIIVGGILAGCSFPEPICNRIWGKSSVRKPQSAAESIVYYDRNGKQAVFHILAHKN